MKLSQLSTDKAADILCELTPYINNIVSDDELMSELKTSTGGVGMTRAQLIVCGVERINKIVPILLKKKRADVYGILSTLSEKSVEEIAKQKFVKTVGQLVEVVKDKELLDFFVSSAHVEAAE